MSDLTQLEGLHISSTEVSSKELLHYMAGVKPKDFGTFGMTFTTLGKNVTLANGLDM